MSKSRHNLRLALEPEEWARNLTPKQLQILTRIQDQRLAHGYSPTMQELADALGVSKVTVFEHIEALIKKGALHRQANKARSLEHNPEFPLPDERRTKVPLVGNIAAGLPIEAVEDRQFVDLEALFTRSRQHERDSETFALRVQGDSMIDEQIRDGDYVIVRQTNKARNGQTVVALLEDDQATLKKFYRRKDHIRLEPANEQYEPILVKHCTIQGVVVGVLRTY